MTQFVSYSKSIHFSSDESPNYVNHPVNSFHLMERTVFISGIIPEIKKVLPNLKFDIDGESLLHDYKRAHHGLADLHEFMNLSTEDIANGIIRDEVANKTFVANSGLNAINLVNIAKEAEDVFYVQGLVNWFKAALKRSETEASTGSMKYNQQFLDNIK